MKRFGSLLYSGCTIAFLLLAGSAGADEGRRVSAVEAWFEAFNRGVEAMAAVRAEHYSEAVAQRSGWEEQLESMRQDLAPLSLEGLKITDETSVEAIGDSNDGPVTLTFEFDSQDRIAGLRIEMGSRGASALPPFDLPADTARHAPALDRYIEGLVEQDLFSGTVLIARPSGEVFYQGAFGLASREYEVPNRLSTRFDVGSINKDYTHLGLLLLAREGTIDLEATVGTYLPDYPQVRVRDEVTLRQLIDHRGGVADYFDDHWGETPMRILRKVEDYLPIWADRPLIAEPGTSRHYSNYGYTILGAVIEAVSGMEYPDFVQQRIFGPAGMTDSGFFAVDSVTPNVATGYTRMGPDYGESDQLWKNIYLEPAVGGPWGKSYSPIEDLFAFYQKLFRHQLIPPGEAWFGAGPIDELGIALGGGGPGLSSMMALENGWMVIVLANLDTPVADDLAQVLIRAVEEVAPDRLPEEVP